MFRSTIRAPLSIVRRNLSSAKPNNANKSDGSVLNADSSASLNRLYHCSGLLLAGLVPLAFVSPSTIAMPMDIAASILIPFHSHVGLNYVVSDYVPHARRPMARALILVASIVATAGLLKLTFHGPGVTQTIKSLWTEKEQKVKKENKH